MLDGREPAELCFPRARPGRLTGSGVEGADFSTLPAHLAPAPIHACEAGCGRDCGAQLLGRHAAKPVEHPEDPREHLLAHVIDMLIWNADPGTVGEAEQPDHCPDAVMLECDEPTPGTPCRVAQHRVVRVVTSRDDLDKQCFAIPSKTISGHKIEVARTPVDLTRHRAGVRHDLMRCAEREPSRITTGTTRIR